MSRYDKVSASWKEAAKLPLLQIARTPLGWAMAGFFACQSLQAFAVFGWFAQIYRDAGFSPTTSGLLLGVITAVGIPMSLLIPGYAARLHSQAWLMVGLTVCYPIGYLGLLISPSHGAWLWAVAVGASMGAFPLALTLIGLRARTDGGTAALSGFAQSVGYLIASVGPFGMGLLFDATGTWTVPLIVLTALSAPQLVFGLMISKPAFIEDRVSGEQAVRSTVSLG
jgi:CP family cyanate transporter-like MFS transporter